MIYIETQTNWPLLSNAKVLLQTSENETYTLTARYGKMAFSLIGGATDITFRASASKRTVKSMMLTKAYVAYDKEELILHIKCIRLLGPFGEFVLICDKWLGMPSFVKPSIEECGLFCNRRSLGFGSEVKAHCNNSRFKRESLIIVSYLWMRKWIRQD